MVRKSSPQGKARYLTRRIIAFLRDNEEEYRIRLVRLRGNEKLCHEFNTGSTDICGFIEQHTILVDFRENVVSTIIHEVLHELYAKKEEKEIHAMEDLVMEYVTEYQATRIWVFAGSCMRAT